MERTTLVAPRWDAARLAVRDATAVLPARRIRLEDCDGLTLAEDLVARTDLPSFDTSAMDGWAVRGPGPWRVVGEVLAGRPRSDELPPGQAVGIATGAAVPTGASAVIRSEVGRVVVDAAGAVLTAPTPAEGMYVRPSGEECRHGEVLVAAGTPVTPGVIGLAAAAGHDDLAVVPPPRVALVLLGDELVHSGVPGPGLVRDSIGPQVPAWVARLGGQVVTVEHGADTVAAHVAALERARAVADLVLTTGGTAAGPVDHLHTAIAECGGTLLVDRVAVRPGHPMLAAGLPRREPGPTMLVGLPGNPQSAIVALLSLAAPILERLAGRSAADPADLPAVRVAEGVPAPVDEDRLVLGRLHGETFTPARHLGSGMLRGLAAATGFAVVPPGGAGAGAEVRWLALP